MEIYFGAKVLCHGGEDAGEVERVVVDTQTREVTHVVGKGKLFGQGKLVPLNMVEGTTEAGLILYATPEQLAQLPLQMPLGLMGTWTAAGEVGASGVEAGRTGAGVERAREVAPESRALTVRETSVALGRDCPVRAIDGELGTLAGVRLDLYTNKLSSIVVEKGALFQRQVDVPAAWIGEISPAQIKLATTVEQAVQLVGPEAGPYLAVEGEEETGEGGGGE